MNIFVILFIIIATILVLRSNYKILCHDVFWLGTLWTFIIGVYLTCGVNYGNYGLSFWLIAYLLICLFAFRHGRTKAFMSSKYMYNTNKEDVQLAEKNITIFAIIGLVGVVIFLYDLYRLNGLLIFLKQSGYKMEYETSILGSIGVLVIPSLLVVGIYKIAEGLFKKNKFNIFGLLLLLGYSVPCIINNGRESLLYIIIAVLSIIGCKNQLNNINKSRSLKSYIFAFFALIGVLSFLWLMIHISKDRFTENEITVFLSEYDVSSRTMQDGAKWGDFEFLYYNILSYFSHQIPFLDFTLQEYDGPHLFGMYELNIISRRLPDFLELDYRLVSSHLHKMYSSYNVDFSGAWNTVLGSFIIDFGRIGCVIVCYLLGYVTGNIRKLLLITHDIKYVVLTALVCLCSFSTVQLGPFYQMLIYMSFVWWYIIFETKKSKQ